MARKGNPRCQWCEGAGVTWYNGKAHKCVCVAGTAAQRAAVRALHSTGATRDPNRPLLDDKDDNE